MRSLLSLLVLCLVSIVAALSSSGNRLLVVLEDQAEKGKYSTFWKELEGRGYSLTFESPKKEGLSLFHLGSRAYDHVLLLPPKSKAYGPALTPNLLLDFMKAEGNILLGLSSESPVPSGIVSLLLELDIHLPTDRSSTVIDHFNFDSSAAEQHDILLVQPPKPLRDDVKNFFGAAGAGSGKKGDVNNLPIVVPHAVGQVLGSASPLLLPILKAPSTAYIGSPKEDGVEELFASGSQISLVSAHQARNSARLTVLGSVEMLQDTYMDNSKYGNKIFAEQISAWTFKELGVLKVGRLQHWLNEGPKGVVNSTGVSVSDLNPAIYRVKNDVIFQIELSEYALTHYTPFTPAANDDVQLEFTMLSPFHRIPLLPVSTTQNSTIFEARFTTPDQHGIFHFRVNYKRPFLTNVDEKRQVTVRHIAHDEWPRSWKISGGWVWIAGIWITVAGWCAFVAVWLYSEPPRAGTKKTQ
ncbi:uncharacterized protein PV09_07898 [Verruconis gallopava]|uniref:Dolichyl-diphosphooligosaccharide--protein glycosyltransferase subunit WBP1 n=1 Tax=Verruconis gallopava TaxID=253628 RepID=A0A0D2A1J1_9PEZI|nr:uncharacterized protein PV09_07898 [Verruconis gallopava]KIW00543.1 hypothetical protein PV09_07898 [Verruconis gallopava]